MRHLVAFSFLLAAIRAQTQTVDLAEGNGLRWYKGNTHMHSLWSDGDAAPELAVKWYRDRDYDFLALSDHNIMLDVEIWFPIIDDLESRLTMARVDELRETFGKDWVVVQKRGPRSSMRLKTLTELKARFEAAGEFLLIPAEEITSPVVHVNAINLREKIIQAQERGDYAVRRMLKANFDAVDEQSKRLGVPMFAHLNHPNWDKGVTAEDIIDAGGERFFEVFNGHAGVRNWGDESRHLQSTDRLWDIILAMRMKEGARSPMYGMGTDDSHNYFKWGVGEVNPGRGWVQVLAAELTPEAIVEAMKAGRFYATSGVTLDAIKADAKGVSVAIRGEAGVTYTTEFIGTRKDFSSESEPVRDAAGEPIPWVTRVYSEEIGQVLKSTSENPARYTFSGDEYYVRARVTSSKPKENPFAEGDFEVAWTQPVQLP